MSTTEGRYEHGGGAAAQAVNTARLRRIWSGLPRCAGTPAGPGEAKAAAYIADRMRAAGVPVTVHEFQAYLSYPIHATLEVLEPEPAHLRCVTHSFGRSTGADGIVADLVYLPDADVARGAGQAALIDGLATPVTILRATRAGCAAVVFANQDRVIHNMIGTTIWGTPGLDQLDRLPNVPAVSVNKESGDALKRLLGRGDRVRVKVTAEVKTGWTPSRLPEVRIPGHRRARAVRHGGRALLLLARRDHRQRDRRRVSDGDGADPLGAAEDLRRSVRVCWWPGHSHGRYAGSTWYADQFFQDLADHCLAYHNIDSPGVRGATRYVARHTTAEIERFCRATIARVTGQTDAPVHRPSRAADQSFLANGVPAFSTYPFLPDGHADFRPWTGGAANAWWWHTEFDTLDKADVDILALDTRVSLTAVIELANAAVLPLNHVDTAAEIRRDARRDPGTRGHPPRSLAAPRGRGGVWRRRGAPGRGQRNGAERAGPAAPQHGADPDQPDRDVGDLQPGRTVPARSRGVVAHHAGHDAVHPRGPRQGRRAAAPRRPAGLRVPAGPGAPRVQPGRHGPARRHARDRGDNRSDLALIPGRLQGSADRASPPSRPARVQCPCRTPRPPLLLHRGE